MTEISRIFLGSKNIVCDQCDFRNSTAFIGNTQPSISKGYRADIQNWSLIILIWQEAQ